jgi:hypothetical protein
MCSILQNNTVMMRLSGVRSSTGEMLEYDEKTRLAIPLAAFNGENVKLGRSFLLTVLESVSMDTRLSRGRNGGRTRRDRHFKLEIL